MPFEPFDPLSRIMYRDIEQARAAQKAKQAKKEVPSTQEKPPVKASSSQSAFDTFVKVASGAHTGSNSQKEKVVKSKLTDDDIHRMLSGLSSC